VVAPPDPVLDVALVDAPGPDAVLAPPAPVTAVLAVTLLPPSGKNSQNPSARQNVPG
jgi:hypothetical protein